MTSARRTLTSSVLLCALSASTLAPAAAITVGGPEQGPALIPTGQIITATAAPGSTFYPLRTGLRPDTNADAAEAVSTTLSPDGKTLLVLTSGYNLNFTTTSGTPITHPVLDPTTGAPTSTTTSKAEWVFVYDVTDRTPKKIQQINIPNTYSGIVWDPAGAKFYVSGGGDDRVYIYTRGTNGQYAPNAPFLLLGHNSNQTAPFPSHDGGILKNTAANKATGGKLATGAVVSGLGVSHDGTQLFAANLENDSVSYVDTVGRKLVGDIAFTTPGSNIARGEYPYDVAVKSGSDGKAQRVYVTSQRDDHVVVVTPKGLAGTIAVGGGPNKMRFSPDGNTLWVCDGNTDQLTAIDTRYDRVTSVINLDRPGYPYHGANPNAIAFGKNGKTMYVSLGGENAVAVVDIASGRVRGRIPTGWYPNSVSVSADGRTLYVVNAKSPAGPNPANSLTTPGGTATNTTHRNEYGWALEKAGLLVIPLPLGQGQLASLSRQVDANNGFLNPRGYPLMSYLHRKIKHVIYIVNENRTYDQVLGDLAGTNGSPLLNVFPQAVSPNHHAFASQFAALDNFYDPGESSGVGWNWTMEGFDTDFVEKHQSVDYGNGGDEGLSYDYQGTNRNMNVSFPVHGSGSSPFFSERITTIFDPTGSSTILPGPKDVGAPAGANDDRPDAIGGYIFDSVLRAGGTIRNYGWQIDQTAYGTGTPLDPALVRHPFENHVLQSPPQDAALNTNTDRYYRGFDQRYPDKFRIEEWQREFADYVKNKNLPTLEMMTVPHDHFGSFSTALEGLNTPTLEFADNDYALGLLLQTVSQSPYWNDTAIFIVEDDSQNGPDHVDSHRSTAFVLSAYTKRRNVVHTAYTTENILATIEQLLGVRPLSFHDANAVPMTDVFQTSADTTAYAPTVPGVLCAPPVSPDLLGTDCTTGKKTAAVEERHDGAWWSAHTVGYDFSRPDHIDSAAFNRLLWIGIKGDDAPLPAELQASASVPAGTDD